MAERVKVKSYKFFDIYRESLGPNRQDQYHVVARSGQLGLITWYDRWHEWVLSPYEGTIWSAGCLKDVAAFLAELKQGQGRMW